MTKILVIDDEPGIRALLRKTLEKAGYGVIEAPNGKEGLRLFRQTLPALVITDLLMPDQDGIEVVMAVRRDAPTARIIAFSGGTGGLDCLESAKLLGAHRTMRKPFLMTDLLQAVQEELQGGSQHRERGPQGAG